MNINLQRMIVVSFINFLLKKGYNHLSVYMFYSSEDSYILYSSTDNSFMFDLNSSLSQSCPFGSTKKLKEFEIEYDSDFTLQDKTINRRTI